MPDGFLSGQYIEAQSEEIFVGQFFFELILWVLRDPLHDQPVEQSERVLCYIYSLLVVFELSHLEDLCARLQLKFVQKVLFICRTPAD